MFQKHRIAKQQNSDIGGTNQIEVENGLYYCGSCGGFIDRVWRVGQFVLVKEPGLKPRYAKILSIKNGKVHVKINEVETMTVEIIHLEAG
jgi:hypothetical protein